MSLGVKLIREALDKEPDIPARTLARRLVALNPGVWTSIESCRTVIRDIMGVKGRKRRGDHTSAGTRITHPREKRQAGGDWQKYLPQATRTLEAWGPVPISGPQRALLLYDVHVPFHDPLALNMAIQYGIDHDATLVILAGDALDCYSISRWITNPKLRDFPGEVRAGRALIQSIRAAFPKARILWKWGNHEERYDARLRLNPEFYGLDDLEWPRVFRYAEHGVEHVGDKRPIVLGKGLNIIHGHEFGGGFSNPVNPARSFFLKAGCHVIGGHYHQTSQHSAKNLEQNVVSAWSSGCLCEEHPDYRPINNWSLGFVFVDLDKSGAFQVENKRIIDGRVW